MISLRALKGAPLSVLLALLLTDQPLSEIDLIDQTGWSKNTLRAGLRVLLKENLIFRHGRFDGYSISHQPFLAISEDPLFEKLFNNKNFNNIQAEGQDLTLAYSPFKTFEQERSEGQKLTLDPVTTTTTFNKKEDAFSEEAAVFKGKRRSKIDLYSSEELENRKNYSTDRSQAATLLCDFGVREPTLSELFQYAWVTSDYCAAMIEHAKAKKIPVGLLIHKIRSHDPKPVKPIDPHDPERFREFWTNPEAHAHQHEEQISKIKSSWVPQST